MGTGLVRGIKREAKKRSLLPVGYYDELFEELRQLKIGEEFVVVPPNGIDAVMLRNRIVVKWAQARVPGFTECQYRTGIEDGKVVIARQNKAEMLKALRLRESRRKGGGA